MPWFWHSEPTLSSSPSPSTPSAEDKPRKPTHSTPTLETSPHNKSRHDAATTSIYPPSSPPSHEKDIIDTLRDPQTLTVTLLLTTTILLTIRLYKTRLRRIPTVAFLRPSHFSSSTSSNAISKEPVPLTRSKSFLGYVTSSHDPDNFRFYHTPGGRLLLWGTPLRRVPSTRAGLKDNTLSVRIAGIDAPELAHFGKPAQPYGEEALAELRSMIECRRARIWPLRRDQYERVVCLVMVKRNLFSWGEGWIRGVREEGWRDFWRRDVGLEMIRRGAATVYEGRFGAEFGGPVREGRYREAERIAKELKLGMWKGASKGYAFGVTAPRTGVAGHVLRWLGWAPASGPKTTKFESPREYKQRMAKMEKDVSDAKKK